MLDQLCPGFSLSDLEGRLHRLSDYRGRIVMLNFWSCDCPHSERTDAVISAWLEEWGGEIGFLPIASNANESPDALKKTARQRRLPVLLCDPNHRVADLFAAQTTPHVYVIDEAGRLRYRGAVDDVTFAQRQPARSFLREAVDALRAGAPPPVAETQPYGCAIIRHALE